MWEDFCDAFICFPDDPFKKSLKFLPHQFVSLRFKTNATMLQNFNHKLKDQSSFKNISSEFYGTLGAIKLVWGCNIFAKKCAQGVCEGEGASWVTGGFHGFEGAAEAGEGADRICGLDLQVFSLFIWEYMICQNCKKTCSDSLYYHHSPHSTCLSLSSPLHHSTPPSTRKLYWGRNDPFLELFFSSVSYWD